MNTRNAALRSTALATSLALVLGLSALAAEAGTKPKVPLPKPRPIARNVVPNPSAKNTAPAANTAAMVFWALLASGQINVRKVDGWQPCCRSAD